MKLYVLTATAMPAQFTARSSLPNFSLARVTAACTSASDVTCGTEAHKRIPRLNWYNEMVCRWYQFTEIQYADDSCRMTWTLKKHSMSAATKITVIAVVTTMGPDAKKHNDALKMTEKNNTIYSNDCSLYDMCTPLLVHVFTVHLFILRKEVR